MAELTGRASGSVPVRGGSDIPTTRTLAWLVDQYAQARDVRPGSVSQLRYSATLFGRWLKRKPTLKDLAETQVNAWVRALLDAGTLSTETIRSKRRHLVCLRRFAYERGWMGTLGTIRPVKQAARIPVAWSQDELAALLHIAALKTQRLLRHRPVAWCAFWRAFILVGYYSGLRLGDLLKLRFEAIGQGGVCVVIQSKTGNALTFHLPEDALAAVAAIRKPERARIFGDLLCRRTIQDEFRWLTREAKIGGSIKRLRASGATWVEATVPGSAMAFLGHRTPGLAHQHYVDPRHIQQNKPRPPRLG